MPLIVGLWACGEVPCDPSTCGACVDPPEGIALTSYEYAMLQDDLAAVRQGVTAVGERSFGWCRGTLTCEEWLGADVVGSPGDFVVVAELEAPAVGMWTMKLTRTCTAGNQELPEVVRTVTLAAGETKRIEPLDRVLGMGRTANMRCELIMETVGFEGLGSHTLYGSLEVAAE